MEDLEPTNMCTYWPAYPAFNPESVLLRRLFFMNEDGKNTCVCFRPARGYLPLVEIGVVRRGGGPKTIILSYEQVDAMAEALPVLRDAMCGGNPVGGSGCKSGAFRLVVTRSRRIARLYVDSIHFTYTTRY
jgi:hypothetical protein